MRKLPSAPQMWLTYTRVDSDKLGTVERSTTERLSLTGLNPHEIIVVHLALSVKVASNAT